MEFDDACTNRRSVRSFSDQRVDDAQVYKIIRAGMQAPSAGNLQHWKFIVVRDPEMISNIAGYALEQQWIAQANMLIVIVGDLERAKAFYNEHAHDFTLASCAAALQNMLLKITDLGLGGCWITGYDEEQVKSLLKIPDEQLLAGFIALGYAHTIMEAEQPLKYDVEQAIFLETYDNKVKDKAQKSEYGFKVPARFRKKLSEITEQDLKD